MKDEQVLLCEGGNKECRCRVDQIVLPDIRFQGLFVSKEEQEIINSAYAHAVRVRDLILVRQKMAVHREWFEIDIPDLWFIATNKQQGIKVARGRIEDVRVLRRELVDELVTFMQLFQSLVRHFIPKANGTGYSYDGKTKHGVKYKGYALVNNDVGE